MLFAPEAREAISISICMIESITSLALSAIWIFMLMVADVPHSKSFDDELFADESCNLNYVLR